MSNYLSAGVYIKETDLSQVVATTSTSVGAIVGEFSRGQINEPVLIQNTKQFIDTFGKPDPVNLTWPTAYAALAFLEQSGQLYVVRSVNADNSHAYAGTLVNNGNGNIAYTSQGEVEPESVTFGQTTEPFYLYAKGPGTYANSQIGVSFLSDNVNTPPVPITITSATATAGGSLTAGTYHFRVTSVTEAGETGASAALSATTSAGDLSVTLVIPPGDGILSYNIYRGTSATNVQFVASVSATGSAITYVDDGSITPSGNDPMAIATSQVVAASKYTETVTFTQFVSGGSLVGSGATYYYKIGVMVGDQETTCSAQFSDTIATVGTAHRLRLNIPHQEGATAYRIYGRTNGTEKLLGTVSASPTGSVVTYLDTGAATLSNSPITTGTGSWAGTGTKYYRVSAVGEAGESAPSDAYTVSVGTVTDHVCVGIPYQSNVHTYNIYRGDSSGTERLLASVPVSALGSTIYVDNGAVIASTQPLATSVTTNGKSDEFTLKVYLADASNYSEVESFKVTLGDKLDGFGIQMNIEDKVNTQSNYIKVYKNPSYSGVNYINTNSTVTYLGGGLDGTAPTASDIALGWAKFADKEQITVRLLINGGVSSVTVQQEMNRIAQRRGDCVAILDVPTQYQSETGQLEVNYRRSVLNLNSNRSALYAPDLLISDPYNDKLLYVPPSGHVAAVYANTDYVAQAWFAPAGLNRGLLSVRGVRYKYNQEARDLMAPAQVNYARNFPGQGIAIWEALTMQAKTSALSYVNVRRLLDIIQVSVANALNYSVWEPNDDFLRRQLVAIISEFLELIRVRRGIIEFQVVSDASNNPPSVTGTGQLNIDVYITPTLPVQKIRLQTVVTKQGANFSELIATGGNL